MEKCSERHSGDISFLSSSPDFHNHPSYSDPEKSDGYSKPEKSDLLTIKQPHQNFPSSATSNKAHDLPNSSASTLSKQPCPDKIEDRQCSNTSNNESSVPHDDDDNYPEGGLRAWSVVLGSWCSMFVCFGLMLSIGGVYETYLSQHQLSQYPESTIGWVFSVYVFVAFFCGVQIGPWFDALGPRIPIAAGSIFILVGVFTLAQSSKLWHFFVTYSLLCGLGSSLLFTPSFACVAHWFRRRRGLATGLACTAGNISGVIFSLALPPLFERVGYAWATRIMGLIFAVFLIFANMLMRARLPPKPEPVLRDFIPEFRILFAGRAELFFCTVGVFALEWGLFIPLTYIGSWAVKTGTGSSIGGVSSISSSTFGLDLLAILNAAGFFGRWVPGLIADRVGPFNTVIGACLACLTALLCFWLPGTIPPDATVYQASSAYGSVPLAVLFAILFGLGASTLTSVTPVCIGGLCSIEEYGKYFATCYTVVSLGCLTGLPIAGALVQACGGEYTGLVVFAGACYVLALGGFVVARVLLVGWKVSAFC